MSCGKYPCAIFPCSMISISFGRKAVFIRSSTRRSVKNWLLVRVQLLAGLQETEGNLLSFECGDALFGSAGREIRTGVH